jgi:hypothetical protein
MIEFSFKPWRHIEDTPITQVTEEDVEGCIASEAYFTAHEGVLGAHNTHDGEYQLVRHDDTCIEVPLKRLTFCVLVLKNGFMITGESACVDSRTFNEETGRAVARAMAINKVWPFLGFAARTNMQPDQAIWSVEDGP